MAKRAESLRSEAARRKVTVYQVRKERGISKGVSARVAVGKGKSGEQSLSEINSGIPAPSHIPGQKYKYEYLVTDNHGMYFTVGSNRRLSRREINKRIMGIYNVDAERFAERYFSAGSDVPERFYDDPNAYFADTLVLRYSYK